MKSILSVPLLLVALLYGCVAPPVTKNKPDPANPEALQEDGLQDYMEYHRYLREVVTALESDPDFRKKLEKAEEGDIRSGKIANELEFVSHQIRNRLDEIKRTELIRLRELTKRKQELQENNSVDDPTHHHLDHTNEHTFEIEDLRKLIFKTTQDLAEADRKRRDEFKEYELQKEYEKQQKLNHTAGEEERAKLESQYQEMADKHKKHEKLLEPGHKQQLEEVWEEQDHMQQDFDPKTFFMLHDLDSNGLWDETEVKALFIKELDKMYAAGAPEDDMRERAEEMERMRESVFTEVDLNKDGFIDYEEFIAQTKRNDFQQDNGWKGLDEQQPPYTDEELQEYIRIHEAQQAHRNQPGVGYHPGQMPPPAGYQQAPPGGYHPNDIYSNPHASVPQQNQLHPGQLRQAQVNPQQIYHQKVPPQDNPPLPGGAPIKDVYPYPDQPIQPNVQYNNNQPNYQQNQQNPAQNMQQPNQPNFQKQNQPNFQQQNQPNFQQQNKPNFQQQNQPNLQQQNQAILQQNQPNLQQQNQPNLQQQNRPNLQQQNQPNLQQQSQPNFQQNQANLQQNQQQQNMPPVNPNSNQGIPQVQSV